jgi:hypothetical protein
VKETKLCEGDQSSRPATVRAYARAAAFQNPAVVTEGSRQHLFGQTAASHLLIARRKLR